MSSYISPHSILQDRLIDLATNCETINDKIEREKKVIAFIDENRTLIKSLPFTCTKFLSKKSIEALEKHDIEKRRIYETIYDTFITYIPALNDLNETLADLLQDLARTCQTFKDKIELENKVIDFIKNNEDLIRGKYKYSKTILSKRAIEAKRNIGLEGNSVYETIYNTLITFFSDLEDN